MTSPITVDLAGNESLLEITLDRPKANIVDAAMIGAIGDALADHAALPRLKAVLLSASGPNFSFGASVEEHLPEQCASMIRAMHGLVLRIVDYPVPVLVAVRGQCLGGGLEVAAAGHLMFAAPDAKMGQPEIKLAVIAPAASCLLPEKIGQGRAEDLLLSGRSMSADEALTAGLVREIADDPEAAARAYFEQHLAPLSAAAIRMATTAARAGFAQRIHKRIKQVESLYLDELMKTHDAVEGLNAFIEKRAPIWENR
jgi:cyclohexa-1,5-dienecarbonyl-CoA hydratase